MMITDGTWVDLEQRSEVPVLSDIWEPSQSVQVYIANYESLLNHGLLEVLIKIFKHSFVHLKQDLQNAPSTQDNSR